MDQGGSAVGESIHPGEVLTCTSESNPAVSEYLWMLTRGNDTKEAGTTEYVTVSDNWLGDVTLQCTVTNRMRVDESVEGSETVEESFNVNSNYLFFI